MIVAQLLLKKLPQCGENSIVETWHRDVDHCNRPQISSARLSAIFKKYQGVMNNLASNQTENKDHRYKVANQNRIVFWPVFLVSEEATAVFVINQIIDICMNSFSLNF